jgi:hypothetical protein
MTKADDERLKRIWDSFCEELKEAGEIIFRETTPDNQVTRLTGLRLLARNISLALQFELENKDPQHPELMHYFDPVRKQGGDNTDALYVGAPINGTDTYRISGTRGSAAYFAITVLETGETPWGGAVIGSLFGPEMEMDEEGRFELIISPEAHSGNWIQSTPDTYRVTFRQFFADWEEETPMDAEIECLTASSDPPPALSLDEFSRGLSEAVDWIRVSTHYWADKIDLWKAKPNQFFAFAEIESAKIDATPGGTPLISYWKVPPEEALIVRVKPPVCTYWNCEFGSYWWETMDYRWRLSNTNIHQATLEADGELVVVVCHDDPGLPNWLDPSGHEEGYITFRWMGSHEDPRPTCTQVSRKSLMQNLPENIRTISPDARSEQLRARRRGVNRRFKI